MTEFRQIGTLSAAARARRFESRLFMKAMKVSVVGAIALFVATTAAGDEVAIESLTPATALAEVRATRGLVFVDLYAHF
jgi:hypothetical protein